MAYVYPWDESQPSGAELAANLDVIIQNLKKSMHERMEPLLVKNWADPNQIVVADKVLGAKVDKKIIISSALFIPQNPSNLNRFLPHRITGIAALTEYIAAITLPPGVTITLMEFIGTPATVVPVCKLQRATLPGGLPIDVVGGDVVFGAPNNIPNFYPTAVQALLVLVNEKYHVSYSTQTAGNVFDGVRITYSCPDNLTSY